MSDDFSWWTAALAGTRGQISADEPMSGFYRQRNRAGEYEPVAFWKDAETGEQRCHINGKQPRDPLRMYETWVHAARNPIPAEWYWSKIDGMGWPDNDVGAAATAKGPEIDPETDPAGSLKAEIAAARAGLDAYKVIESDEAAARSQSLRSALTGLSGKATKAYEALNRPLLDEQKRIREVWFSLRDLAADGALDIRKAQEKWEDDKREAARKAQAETDRKAAEHAAAVRSAEEANQPPPPPPPPQVAPNTPAPSAQIRGGSGRTASVRTKKIVTKVDMLKAWEQFGGMPEVYNLFMNLAQKAVDAGIDTPCATVDEKADVR